MNFCPYFIGDLATCGIKDSMFRTVSHMSDEPEWERHKVTVGLNYSPIKEIVIKAEASERILRPQFNNEPTLSIGIAYMGMYKLL